MKKENCYLLHFNVLGFALAVPLTLCQSFFIQTINILFNNNLWDKCIWSCKTIDAEIHFNMLSHHKQCDILKFPNFYFNGITWNKLGLSNATLVFAFGFSNKNPYRSPPTSSNQLQTFLKHFFLTECVYSVNSPLQSPPLQTFGR